MVKKTRCSVLGCYNSSKIYEMENISYFRLPKDRCRARKWLQAIKRKPASKIVVCELHFETELMSVNTDRKRLAAHAVPTLLLPDDDLLEKPSRDPRVGRVLVCHQATQAPTAHGDASEDEAPIVDIFVKEETVVGEASGPSTDSAPTDWAIKEEAPDETPEPASPLTDLDMLVKLSKAYLSPQLAKLIQVQAQGLGDQINNASKGNQNSKNILMSALKLYYAFPQSYKLMQESLSLPSMGQLKRSYRPLTWEINARWMQLLKLRFAGASAAERECVLCMAVVPLKASLGYDAVRDRLVGLDDLDGAQRPRIARSAVVLLARGVHALWRQPLACCLLPAAVDHSEVWMWLDTVIAELFNAGLIVRALVTDHDLVPVGKPVTPDRPYFTVKDRLIYFFYDITRLVISFRNFFMEHDVNFGGLMASWEDIEELHEYNNTRAYKLVPTLTRAHVQPAGAECLRADLAVQVLATPVAAALAAAVELRVLDDTAHGTVQLVAAMAALYEHLHSKKLTCSNKPDESPPEAKVLNDMLARLDRLFLVKKHSLRPVCDPGVLAALRGNVRAALTLLERVRRDGHACLPMRAFNNDPLHELFNRLRALNKGESPTGKQLLDAFRRAFGFNILKSFKPPSKNSELDDFLKAVENVPRGVARAQSPPAWRVPWAHYASMLCGRPSRAHPMLPRQLLERCMQRHAGCEAARVYCVQQQFPVPFLQFLQRLEARFREHFTLERLGAAALGPLLRRVELDTFETPCPCFPTSYLKALYMHFRIHNLILYNNNRFRQNSIHDFHVNTAI